MRLLNKYKIHEHFASALRKLPLRVLKFKRTKWAKIQKKIKIARRRFVWKLKKKFRKKKRFHNVLSVQTYKKVYCNKLFLKRMETKKYLKSLYDNSLKEMYDKKEKERKNVVSSILVKPMYRIDLFLFYMKFFVSSWGARQAIQSGNILVNSRIIGLNYEIKKGDLISFDFPEATEDLYAYVLMQEKFLKNRNFFPFLEYDYYSNSFIVVKNWTEFSKNDFSLIFKERKNVRYAMYK